MSNCKSEIKALSLTGLIFYMYMPFFLWSFLGGHKQVILGVSSDYLATASALCASLVVIFSKRSYWRSELLTVLLYGGLLGCFILSLLVSFDPIFSTKQVLVYSVYAVISFGCAVFFKNRLDSLFEVLVFAACFSAFIIIVSYFFLGMGAWGRVTIPVYEEGYFSYFPRGYESSSDPNVLSYFTYFGALIILYAKGFRGWWRLAFFAVLAAGILTMSRSGFLAFFVALSVFSIVVFSSKSDLVGRVVKVRSVIALFFLFFIALICMACFFNYESFYSSLLDRLNSEGSNADRYYRIFFSLDVAFSDVQSFLIGRGLGYSRSTVDPHLFFLSTIIDAGFFSLVFLLVIMCLPVFAIVLNSRDARLVGFVLSSLVFFLVISMFYWQLRTYFFILLVLSSIYFSTQRRLV